MAMVSRVLLLAVVAVAAASKPMHGSHEGVFLKAGASSHQLPGMESPDLKMTICNDVQDMKALAGYYGVPEPAKILAVSSVPKATCPEGGCADGKPAGKAIEADITTSCANFTFAGRDWDSVQQSSYRNASLHAGSYIRFYAVNGDKKQIMDQFNLWEHKGFDTATVKQVTKNGGFFLAVTRNKRHDGIGFYLYNSAHEAAVAGHKCQCAKLTPAPKSAASGPAATAAVAVLLAGALLA